MTNIEDDPRIKRILAMVRVTKDEEHIWNQGPLGPREDIYAVWDDGNAVYYDGDDNVLEPGWVLRILRGTDAIPLATEELLNHEWMRARNTPALTSRASEAHHPRHGEEETPG